MHKCSLLLCAILFIGSPNNVIAQAPQTNDVPLGEALARIKSLLVQHYKPKMVVPKVAATFVPIAFDSCNIKWKSVARSKGLTYTIQQSLDLADLNPEPPIVLMSEMPKTDRWFFELRTSNEERKIKGDWIVTRGSRLVDKRHYLVARSSFGADSQEAAQQIADQVVSVIKQCSQRRAEQAPGAHSP